MRSTYTRVTVEHIDGSQSIFSSNDYWTEYQKLLGKGLRGRELVEQLLPRDLHPPPRLVTLVVEGKEMARVKCE